ncbi:MAG: DEAD/DEAH box helicase [Rhodospirillales bacterium]|jgi:ATP-dependent RNA helicase RhlE|nr:DEAD/DEAH box helicase [Rhodospirillales bacterium]
MTVTFSDLGLVETLLNALKTEGYETPTPIQAATIPHLLNGRDVLGIAQTGTGKTAAFALPILQRLANSRTRYVPKSPRALILTPTRELAVQISQGFGTYGQFMRFKRALVFGGVGQMPQVKSLANGTDVLIATPGRLLDLMNQGHVKLDFVEMLVLDEADRMLDMGFIHDVRRIAAKLPKQRQTLLFSATMAKSVEELANTLLTNPERVEITPEATTVERIDQKVLFVTKENKRPLLAHVMKHHDIKRAIVFTRTKHGADRVAEQLGKAGITADAIHGNKTQGARQKALEAFKRGDVRALVATDIAARGIDIDGITHVINFELPNEPESYVHRIGRTARAGADGIALSFCDAEEVGFLKTIERTIRQSIPSHDDHAFHAEAIASQRHAAHARPAQKRQGQASRKRQGPPPGKKLQHRNQPPRHAQAQQRQHG